MKKVVMGILLTLVILIVALCGCLEPGETTANKLPIAEIRAVPISGIAPLTVYFESYSSDPDGEIISWEWTCFSLDDGVDWSIVSELEKFSYTFNSPGEYDIQLSVQDDDNAFASKSIGITVKSMPDFRVTHSEAEKIFGWDYGVKITATITNFGGSGSATVVATVIQDGNAYSEEKEITLQSQGTRTLELEIYEVDFFGGGGTYNVTFKDVEPT